MSAELKNQTLVAAESARQQGFIHTYEALLELVRKFEQREDAISLSTTLSGVSMNSH